jgi:cytochrome c oxidase subunit II
MWPTTARYHLKKGRMGLRGSRLAFLAIAMVVVGIIGVVVITIAHSKPIGTWGVVPIPTQASTDLRVANGSRIYFTAIDSSGQSLSYQGRGMMMRVTCANCHGPDGHGVQTPMFTSPNVTYRNLTDPAGMLEPDGQRMSPYNDDTLKRVITQGIDTQGKPLDWPMPRWQMTDNDLGDLISFLKTLR